MKQIAVLATTGVVALFALGATAQAFSVVNQDAEPHVLKITEGDNAREVRLEANQQADGLCSSMCNVVLDDSDEAYEVAASERLLIEEGLLLAADEPTQDQPLPEDLPADAPIDVQSE